MSHAIGDIGYSYFQQWGVNTCCTHFFSSFQFESSRAVQAVVGSIVWAFRSLKNPKSREMSARGYALHSVCAQFFFQKPVV